MEKMKVDIKINNLPKEWKTDNKYMVVRRDPSTAMLWYFGTYRSEEQAMDIANELDNGIVVEREV